VWCSLRIAWWLVIAQAALMWCSYARVRRLVETLPMRRHRRRPMTPLECELAIGRVSRRLAGATCLSRAVAAAAALRRDGVESTLTIGVAFDARHRFTAHAWVRAGGRMVCGGTEAPAHTALLSHVILSRP